MKSLVFISCLGLLVMGEVCFAQGAPNPSTSALPPGIDETQLRQELQGIQDQASKAMAQAEEVNRKMAQFSPAALIGAAFQNNVAEAEILLKGGADPNIREERYNLSALGAAATKGSIEVIELLLKHGADINKGDLIDNTPLMLAAMYNQLEAAKALVKHGADLKLKNKIGKTAAGVAKLRGFDELATYLTEQESKGSAGK